MKSKMSNMGEASLIVQRINNELTTLELSLDEADAKDKKIEILKQMKVRRIELIDAQIEELK